MYKLVTNVDSTTFLTEAADLITEHWEELALNKDKIRLCPDVVKYKQLQDLNILHNVVVYKDDEIVGYSVLLVQPHLHYANDVYASVDVIYVSKNHRQSSVGARLLVTTEDYAKSIGVAVIMHHAKPYVPMIIRPLEKLGYTLYEQIYGKYLGE